MLVNPMWVATGIDDDEPDPFEAFEFDPTLEEDTDAMQTS